MTDKYTEAAALISTISDVIPKYNLSPSTGFRSRCEFGYRNNHYTMVENGNKVLFCGNGGSAADAQHLAAEFSGRFYKDRKALPAEALHCNTSYITAVANDYSYDVIYSRMVDGIGNDGDVIVGLSTSGNSKNIIKAFETAKEKNMITIGFTSLIWSI